MKEDKKFSCGSPGNCLPALEADFQEENVKDVHSAEANPIPNFVGQYINSYTEADTIYQDEKFFDKIYIRTENAIFARYIYGFADPGSQINSVSKKLVNGLQQYESIPLIDCNKSITISGFEEGSLRLCLTKLHTNYRCLDKKIDYYIRKHLERVVGSPVLIGATMVNEVREKEGWFLPPPEKSMKYERKMQNTQFLPRVKEINIRNLKARLKKSGEVNDVAKNFQIPINMTYDAIKREKGYNEDKYTNYLLKKLARTYPNNYLKKVMRNYMILASKIDYLKNKIVEIEKVIAERGNIPERNKARKKLKKELKFHRNMFSSMSNTIVNKQFKAYKSIWNKELGMLSRKEVFSFKESSYSWNLSKLYNYINRVVINELKDCPVKFPVSSIITSENEEIRIIVNKSYKKTSWRFIAEILLTIDNDNDVNVIISILYSQSYQNVSKKTFDIIKNIVLEKFLTRGSLVNDVLWRMDKNLEKR